MAKHHVIVLNWNVRGLNAPHRRNAVRDMVNSTHATIVCLQETKLQIIDEQVVRSMLGAEFCDNYSYLPASEVRGGIIIAVSDRHFSLISTMMTDNTITVTVKMLDEGAERSLTSVYAPQWEQEKGQFIEELKGLKTKVNSKWLITGDFNLIYKAEAKNNARLNRRLMGKFRQAIDQLEIKELPLHGRK